MLYELFLIMIFAFIIYHFYVNVANYLNIGTPFIEGMTSQKKIFNFFPSSNINKRGKPMDSASGSLSQVKTIPGDAASNIKLDYEFKIRDQGWGNNTYGEVYLINKTTNKTKLIKKGKGRGTQTHKGSMDISDHVKAGDKVQIKFKTSRWTSGHKLFWFYLKNLHLTYTPRGQGMKLMNKGWTPKLPSGTKLKKCEGDCDRDTDCEKGLKCFQRRKKEKVPGCQSGGSGDKKGMDFCYDPKDIKPKWPRWPGMRNLVDMGGSMQKVPKGQKLKECEGDCDKDADCATGLKCYQRNSSIDQVPGCKIGGKGDIGDHDYCYDPKKKKQIQWDNSMWNNRMNRNRMQRRNMGQGRNMEQRRNMGQGSHQMSQQPTSYDLDDTSTAAFQRFVPNQQQQPKNNKIVSKEVIVQVLKNKKLILGGYNIKTYDYNTNIGIGKRFMTEMSIVRNLAVPNNIEDTEYATIGQNVINVVSKQHSRHTNVLMNNVKKVLGGNRLASSQYDTSTTPGVATSRKTTGMFSDNCNRLITTRDKLTKKISKDCSPNMKKGLTGTSSNFTDAYKPVDDARTPQPYDSVWGVN